jgi:DNA-binding MarR family transcriptional regulator
MEDRMIANAFRVGNFFVSDIYAYYLDTYKGLLGKVQVEALDHLYSRKNASIKDLAERLNISKQHASKIAARLEGMGLISGCQNPRDGRSILYGLTETGSSFIEAHISLSNQHLKERLRNLPQEERSRLAELLAQIADILNKS